MSSGVIGQNLPIKKMTFVNEGLKRQHLGSSFEDWKKAAETFMTADTLPKLRARTFKTRDKEYVITGMDKDAGIIRPNMGPHNPPPLDRT